MLAWSLEAPGRFGKREVQRPEPSELSDGEVLLRMLVGGICGSDLPHFAGRMHLTMVGDDAPGAARIAGYPLHEIVGEVDAITLQPLACVLSAMNDLGDVRGAAVAVLGQGPVGLLFSHVAKTRGARVVTGVDRVDRSDCVADFRLDRFEHSSTDRWAATVRDEDAPDVVIEAIGHQVGTLTDAIEAVAVNGRIHYFGIPDDAVYPIPMRTLLRKRLTVWAGWVLPEDRRAALAEADAYLAQAAPLAKAFVTDVFDFDDVPSAFQAAATPKPGQRKIAITFGCP
jgi:L-iditol 2-dehydrogenase